MPGLAHTWALQATARRFGSVTVRVPVTSIARLTKSSSFLALRPRCGPWPGCSFVAGRPPGPRTARPGHRPQPAPSFAKLRAPPPAPASFVSPCLRSPSLRLCAPLRLVPRLRCLRLKLAAPSSRSRRVRARQGILPVKTLGGGVLRVVEVPFAQTFAGCPSLTRARPPRWGAHRFGFGQNKWVPVVRPLRGTV